jgi:hypothetical protein
MSEILARLSKEELEELYRTTKSFTQAAEALNKDKTK